MRFKYIKQYEHRYNTYQLPVLPATKPCAAGYRICPVVHAMDRCVRDTYRLQVRVFVRA
jgi:hypothetical protein